MKYKDFPLFVFFLFIHINSIAQIVIKDSNVKVMGDMIGKYFKHTTVNYETYATQVDTTALRNIVREEMESVIIAFKSEIQEKQKQIEDISKENIDKDVIIELLRHEIKQYNFALEFLQKELINRAIDDKKYNYLPFGIHQFKNKQIGKGILFAGTELGLLRTSMIYHINSRKNFDKHKNDKYAKYMTKIS